MAKRGDYRPNSSRIGASDNNLYNPLGYDWNFSAAPPPATGGRTSSGPKTRGGTSRKGGGANAPGPSLGGSLFGPAWWYNLFANQGGQTLAQQAAGMAGQAATTVPGVPPTIFPANNPLVFPSAPPGTATNAPVWYNPLYNAAGVGAGVPLPGTTSTTVPPTTPGGGANVSAGSRATGWYDPYGNYLGAGAGNTAAPWYLQYGGAGSGGADTAYYYSPNYATGGVGPGYGPGMRRRGATAQAQGPTKRYGFQSGGQMLRQLQIIKAQQQANRNTVTNPGAAAPRPPIPGTKNFQTGQAITVANPSWQSGLANLNL